MAGATEFQGHPPTHFARARASRPSIAIGEYFVVEDDVLQYGLADKISIGVANAFKSVKELQVRATRRDVCPPPRSGNRRRNAASKRSNLAGAALCKNYNAEYALSGHVVRRGQSLHITQRVYSAASGRQIRSFTFEAQLDHFFEMERRIVGRVVSGILPEVREAEIHRALGTAPKNRTAYELTLRAMVKIHGLERKGLTQAFRDLKRAVELDPEFAMPLAWQARILSIRIGQGWSRNRLADAERAMHLAEAALALDPNNALALATAGHLKSYLLKQHDVAAGYLARAREACPNEPLTWLLSSPNLAYTGYAKEGRECAEYAISLTPYDRSIYVYYGFAGICCYAQRDYKAAEDYARRALVENPSYSTLHKLLIVSLVAQGKTVEAREVTAELLRIEPRYPAIAASTVPFQDPAIRSQFLRQLRTAGVFDTRRRKRQ